LDRNIRPVGEAYRELITDWGAVLPTQSIVLSLPITPRHPEVNAVGDAAAVEHATEARPPVVLPDTPGSSSTPTPASISPIAAVPSSEMSSAQKEPGK
ncbi:MAG: hypothetical protein ACR2M1_05750, partial [Gemmatimonadaceae bacterium]